MASARMPRRVFWRIMLHPTTQRLLRNSKKQELFFWAAPIWMNLRWVLLPRTPRTGPRATPIIPIMFPAVLREGRRLRSKRDLHWPRLVLIPEGLFGNPRHFAEWWELNQRMVRCRVLGLLRWLLRWIKSAFWRRRRETPRYYLKQCAGTIRWILLLLTTNDPSLAKRSGAS